MGLAAMLTACGDPTPANAKYKAKYKPDASPDNDRARREAFIERDFKKRGLLTNRAYHVFGGKYYFPVSGHPVARREFSYRPLKAHAFALRPGAKLNRGADKTGWVPVPVAPNRVYFRGEYHLKNLALDADGILKDIPRRYQALYGKLGVTKSHTAEQKQLIRTRAKIHIAVFRTAEFRLRWHPGRRLLMRAQGDQFGRKLAAPRGGAILRDWFTRITPDRRRRLTGILNGTFHNQDTKRKHRGREARAGLVLEGRVIDPPLPGLGTFAMYRDGSFRIGHSEEFTGRNFNEQRSILALRQNEYLLLHGSRPHAPGAYPLRWRSFADEILRSYIAVGADGKTFAYAWTIYCPPALAAAALRKLNMDRAMLLDIHPVIAAILADPRPARLSLEEYAALPFRKRSYHFVPDEKNTVNFLMRTLAVRVRGPIQWDHYLPVEDNLPKDFFSIERLPASER